MGNMSKKNVEEIKEELKPIEEIAKELEIKDSVLAGVMAFEGWKKGKVVSKEEFEKALIKFLNKTI